MTNIGELQPRQGNVEITGTLTVGNETFTSQDLATQTAKYGHATFNPGGALVTSSYSAISGSTTSITVETGDVIYAETHCYATNQGGSGTGLRPYLSSGSATLITVHDGWTSMPTNPVYVRGHGLWEATGDGTINFVTQIYTSGFQALTYNCRTMLHVIGKA